MRILYHSRTRKPDLEKELGIKYVDFEILLKESDFVTLHTLNTRNLSRDRRKRTQVNEENSVSVNTYYVPVIDEKALYKALKKGGSRELV